MTECRDIGTGRFAGMLQAAIAAGADAVYLGGTRFGARAYAQNLSEEDMVQAIEYVHIHRRKIYMTVNTLLKDREMENCMHICFRITERDWME